MNITRKNWTKKIKVEKKKKLNKPSFNNKTIKSWTRNKARDEKLNVALKYNRTTGLNFNKKKTRCGFERNCIASKKMNETENRLIKEDNNQLTKSNSGNPLL